MKKNLFPVLITFIGFILSPLSWWNDLFVNFPISYILSIPFGLLNKGLFLPVFIINYWLTNILGLWLMHLGIVRMKDEGDGKLNRKELLKTMVFGMGYTFLIIVLVLTGILEFPEEFLDKLG